MLFMYLHYFAFSAACIKSRRDGVSLQLLPWVGRHALLRHIVKMALFEHWSSLEFACYSFCNGF